MKLRVFFLSLCNVLFTIGQQDTAKLRFEWITPVPGLSLAEFLAPESSPVNDSKLSVVRITPSYFEFDTYMASAYDKKPKTALEWADSFKLNIVVNAGMYDLRNPLKSNGFLKNAQHTNQSQMRENYNAVIAFGKKDSLLPDVRVIDLKCDNWEKWRKKYHCLAQGMRMIDCVGSPMTWNKKKQACSMLVTAMDEANNLYFIFCRSPYTHNQMIGFMQAFPVKLINAVYMEGGPQTSLLVRIQDVEWLKIGSYVSDTYERDDNDTFRKLPNVFGLKYKEQH